MSGPRTALLGLILLAAAPSAWGQQTPQGKLVLDLWDVAYLQGGKAGFVHTTVHEYDVGGHKVLRSTVDLQLTVKRFNDAVQLRAQTGTDETPDGRVLGVFMHQHLGKGKILTIIGKVAGKELQLTLDGKPMQPAPWDDGVIGLYRQQRLFQEKKVKPGDKFSYQSFEPTVNLVVATHVVVKGHEEVELFGGKQRKKLLRVEAKPEKIENVQLPPLIAWLGEDLTPVRAQVEVPGLGQMTLYRTTRDIALSPGPQATLTEIAQLVPLSKRLPRGYNTTRATYRVTYRGDDDPATTFSRDDRQEVKNVKGQVFEIHVRASQPPESNPATDRPGDEFLQSSYFINSTDGKVKELARKAVGAEKDGWKKALRIEKWVHDHMTSRSHEALATADHVARTLEGDCTEYSMLTAAMCRAEGVPSRTAIGLIYADVKGRPVMAFHMWTEVWALGQWVPLDSTLGRGYVGASHLKITDHSWHNRRDLSPLLPVVRVLGKIGIEVLESQ
ncbi:MAG: transglutaminase-like domain-containing protein [Gemmataceae bacterium]|nr:transglutaminase-like domain-containing protein [Gemmataceae bacterium]